MSLTRLLAFLLVVCLVACHGSSGSGPGARDLGIEGSIVGGHGELWALVLDEEVDENGDGDASDTMLRIYDSGTGELVDTLLAPEFGGVTSDGELLAFAVSEARQGGTDLNGDGDAIDPVLHVFDRRTGLVTNTGLAAAFKPAIGLDLVAVAVLESMQGNVDLDGDGTTTGSVLHVYDATTRVAINTSRLVSFEPVFEQPFFVYFTSEATRGDLNGDFDTTDTTIVELFDALSGSFTTLPLAAMSLPVRAGPLADWYVLVNERFQNVDLDEDGDLDDVGVYVRVAPDLQTIESLRLPSVGDVPLVSNGRYAAMGLWEADGIDRNGDGDLFDGCVVLHDLVTGEDFIPPLARAASSEYVFVGERLAIVLEEGAQDEDLNSDGDLSDRPIFLVDPAQETSTYLGVDDGVLAAGAGGLVIGRGESSVQIDWTADGDLLDIVQFVWDPRTETLASTQHACEEIACSNSFSILFAIDEDAERRDWNGDTDTEDQVYALYDMRSRAAFGLGLAAGGDARVLPDGALLFSVPEFGQGRDLNGDGDFRDSFLHVLE